MTTSITLQNIDLPKLTILAAAIARTLKPKDVVTLHGDLGAGKTQLCRLIIRHLTHKDEVVPSPTYTIAQTYDLKNDTTLWHFDFYRLDEPDEAFEIGIDQAFAEDISLIEWPEKITPHLPKRRLEIHLAFALQTGYRNIMIYEKGDMPSLTKELQKTAETLKV